MIYLRLFYEFFKTGLFAFGGGLATLPFLYQLSDSTGWFSHADLANMIAVSESTPGPIGVNMATYVGFQSSSIAGAMIATIGLITPSVIVILIIYKILTRFKENQYVKAAFYGLRPASAALIASAGFSVFKITMLRLDAFEESGSIPELFNWKALCLGVVIFFLLKYVKGHPFFYIAGAAVVGAVLKF